MPCLARFVGFLLEDGHFRCADLGQCGGKPGIFFQLDQLAGVVILQLLLRAIERVGAEEDARQCIVVALGDWIELMIMAASTGDGEPEEGLRHGVDLFIDEVHGELAAVALVVALGPDGEEARSNDLLALLALVLILQEVTSNLLLDELVIGLVFIEGLNDVVAIAPGMRVEDVGLLATGFGISGDIQPMTAPAFAKAGRVQILIDDALHGIRRGVCEKGGNLIGCWRQAGEVEGKATDQGAAVGIGNGSKALGFEVGEDELVDVRARPVGILHFGRWCGDRLLESPVLAAFSDVDLGLGCLGEGRCDSGIRRAHLDPFLEVGQHFSGQLLLGRHLHVLILPRHGLVDGTGGRIARDDTGLSRLTTS